jgi:hypothetical protein
MGLEDYRVLLKAKPRKRVFPDDNAGGPTGAVRARPTAAEAAGTLEQMGFARLPPPAVQGPAKLAEAPDDEIRLTARHGTQDGLLGSESAGEYVVEALIRTGEPSDSPARQFESLSLRFAVCQPEAAAWHFLKLVKRICEALSLAVVRGEKSYSPETFWAFRLRANEEIRSQQALWRTIFEGDAEHPAVGVDESWSHFLLKHPGLLASGELTLAPRESAETSCVEAEVDVEETLPPKAARALPVRRGNRP